MHDRSTEIKMTDEISDIQARNWVAKTVQAYNKAAPGSTTGLHDYIASAPRPRLFTTMSYEEQINRVNRAIEEWERLSMRSPGPRVVSLNEAAGEVEVR
jgi:hypothetical protein